MTFSHPWFLLGLLAVAVPVIVHLFNFRHYRKVYFSNVSRLSELQEETRRSSRLRQLLLLAIRILAVICIVLVFADPVVGGHEQVSGNAAVSVYIDNSYSMKTTDSEGSLLETAKRKVREVVAAYSPSDDFQLFTADMSGSQFQWLSRDELLAQLDDISYSSSVPLSYVAKRQQHFLHSSASQRRHAYIFTDAQASTASCDEWPSDSSVLTTIVPLSAAKTNNLYIDSVALSAPIYCKGATVALSVALVNEADDDLENVSVRLYVDGRERAIASANVSAYSSAEVALSFVAEHDGPTLCYVETDDYPITFDDKMFFSFNVVSSRQVVVVGEKNNYVERLFAHDSLISYRQYSVNMFDYSTLDNYSLVVLNEPQSMSDGLVQALVSYVADGGSLFIVPPASQLSGDFTSLLNKLHLPAFSEWDESNAKALLLASQSSFYQGVFDGRQSEQIEMPSVSGHYHTLLSSSTIAEPLISFSSTDCLLLRSEGEAGVVYLVSCPLSDKYTDFVQQALFVPTLFNMALFDMSAPVPYYEMSPSHPVVLMLKQSVNGQVPLLSVIDDDTSNHWQAYPTYRPFGSKTSISINDIPQASNFLLQPFNHALSFNYSRSESKMSFLSPSQLQELLQQQEAKGYEIVENPQRSMEQYIRLRDNGRHLWRLFVVLALCCLLGEILVARLWGRR